MLVAAVLPRRIPGGRLTRFQCRALSASTSRRKASELETVLRSQDPHDRIQFFADVQFPKEADSYKSRMAWLSGGLFAGKVEAEPHLLPFWTVVVLVSRTWLVKNVQDGSRNNKYKQLQWPTAQAFTVAAVPETHWAHGLVLTPDIFELSVASKYPWSLDELVSGDRAHLFPHYDPELAPKFAYGPPAMSRKLLQEIADRQPLLYDLRKEQSTLDKSLREVHILGETSTFAFPHYRLMYRQTNDSESENYFDAAEIQNGGMQRLSRIPGKLGRRTEEDLGGACRPTHIQWFPTTNHHVTGYCPPSESAEVHELVVGAMRDNPIHPQVWEDAQVLPWSPIPQSRGADWPHVEEYTRAFLQKKSAPEPVFPGVQRRTPGISDHLRRRASAASAGSTAGPAAAPGGAPGARPSARKQAGPAFTDSREQVETRNRLLRQRLREQVQRQRAWKEHLGVDDGLNWKTPSTPGIQSQLAAAYEEKQWAAGRPQPAVHKIISDPRSYYKRLGLSPEPRHLQYFHEKAVDAEIKEVYRDLTLENHPDRAQSPEDEARLHHIMANINVAKDNLDTADKRIEYHNRFSPTKLYR